MKAEFKPISMRCNKKQFEAIKPKLEKSKIHLGYCNFATEDYLTNSFGGENYINSTWKSNAKDYGRTVYETWDEATFLRCCGIEVEETFTVSKEFILEAHKSACSTWRSKIEKEFPQLFERKLEVGKWYKAKGCLFNYQLNSKSYGFDGKTWIPTNWVTEPTKVNENKWIPILATESEVKTALIAEAEKRGFKEGISIVFKSAYDGMKQDFKYEFKFELNKNFLADGNCNFIFYNGKWATIIEKPIEMTVAEIEAKLGHSIKIVK